MDIHKPKAAHSWREFLIEIGTIICGILIALGLEQAVEAVRIGKEVKESREAVRTELAYNLHRLRFIQSEDACETVRLALFERWADGTARPKSGHLFEMNSRPHLSMMRNSAWEVAKSGAVAAHMPVEERLEYATIYDTTANVRDWIVREREAWIRLARYGGKGVLDPAEARALREDVETARAYQDTRRSNIEALASRISKLGIEPKDDGRMAGFDPRALCADPG